MNKKVGLISPNLFIAILLVFGLTLSFCIFYLGMPSIRTFFAANAMTVDYEEMRNNIPTEKIQMFFNKDVDHSYVEGNSSPAKGNIDFRDIIIERIDATESTIDLAVMYLFDESIVDALKVAKQRGVQVRIITDHEGLTELEPMLEGSNIEYKDNNGGMVQEGYGVAKSIMHYKYGIFDHDSEENSYLITSSANWSEKGFDVNANNLLQIQDQKLVAAYLDEFEQMWGGKFNRNKDLSKHHGEVFEIDGRVVELWMSPSNDPFTSFMVRYVNLFEEAEESIYFATFNFTIQRLSQELEKKFNEGIDMKGLSNDGIWDIRNSVYFDMRGVHHSKFYTPWKNIPFENIRHDAIEGDSSLHYKYFIVDEEILITGASNPTTSAIYTNDEDILIIHDPLLANEAKQNFMKYFKKYGGLTRDSIIKIENFDDENDSVTVKNLTENKIDLSGWKIVSTEDTYIDNEFFLKKEFVIEEALVLKAGETLNIDLPADFISDNYESDKFPHTNSRDDGEIYLFDNFALLHHMVWY